MSVIDDFTNYHEELLEGHYDCVDRIVVNAYFEYAQSAGGFRSWWRAWMGSDGVAQLTAYSILRDQVIKPLLAGVVRRQGRPPKIIIRF